MGHGRRYDCRTPRPKGCHKERRCFSCGGLQWPSYDEVGSGRFTLPTLQDCCKCGSWSWTCDCASDADTETCQECNSDLTADVHVQTAWDCKNWASDGRDDLIRKACYLVPQADDVREALLSAPDLENQNPSSRQGLALHTLINGCGLPKLTADTLLRLRNPYIGECEPCNQTTQGFSVLTYKRRGHVLFTELHDVGFGQNFDFSGMRNEVLRHWGWLT